MKGELALIATPALQAGRGRVEQCAWCGLLACTTDIADPHPLGTCPACGCGEWWGQDVPARGGHVAGPFHVILDDMAKTGASSGPSILGLYELAERLGINYKTAAQRRTRGQLPPADAELRSGPVWRRETIERWLAQVGPGGGVLGRFGRDV